MFDPSAKRKAELILLGNCKIGLHEQTQPFLFDQRQEIDGGRVPADAL